MRAVVTPFSSIMYYRSIHPLNLIWFWWLHYKKIILCDVGTLYINVRNQIWSQFQVHYMFYMKCFTIMEMGFCLPKSGGNLPQLFVHFTFEIMNLWPIIDSKGSHFQLFSYQLTSNFESFCSRISQICPLPNVLLDFEIIKLTKEITIPGQNLEIDEHD